MIGQYRLWFQKFHGGDTNLEDQKGRGHPSAIDKQLLKTLVEQNLRQSVSISTILDHLKKIGKMKTLNKWVPHELSKSQNVQHFEVCSKIHFWNSDN